MVVIVRYYIPRRLYLCQYSIHVDHVDWWWPWPRLFATLNAGEKKSCFHFIQPALSALVSVRVIRQWNHTVWFSILNVAAGDKVTHPLWLDFVLCGNLYWVHSTPPIHHYLLAILLISPPPLPPPPPPPSLKPPAALLPPFSTICYLFKTSHPALASHHPPPPNPSPTTPPPNTF